MLAPWKKSYDQPRQFIKKQRHYFANKGLSSQIMVFPVVMYGCESWTLKKVEHQRLGNFELWCWRQILRQSLGLKDILPVNPKGNQSRKFIGRTDAEVGTAVLWPPDMRNWLLGKDSNGGKD